MYKKREDTFNIMMANQFTRHILIVRDKTGVKMDRFVST